MGNIKMKLKNDMMLYRMIALFSMVSAFVILLLTTVIFSVFSSRLKNEIYHSEIQNLKQISNTVSFRAEYVNSLMLQTKEDELISKLFYSTDDGHATSFRHRLDDIRSPVKQLNSIYVYNEYEDRIYYSGENMLPFINSTTTFDDEGFVEILNNIEQYPKYTPILRKLSIEWPAGNQYETYVYTYLIYDSYNSGAVRNVIAFNFHLGWMKDALNYISTGNSTFEEIWIIDSNRQIVYTTSGSQIGDTCEQDVLSDDVFREESGYYITGFGKDRKMIVYATPSRMGYEDWTFVSWSDYATLMRPLEQIRWIIYLACLIVFLVSLYAVFRLSHALYAPVRLTIGHMKVLEEENLKSRKIERMLFLRKLFLGDVTDDIELLRILFQRHQIEDFFEDFQVVLFAIDNIDEFFREYGKQMDETSELIEEEMTSQFNNIFPKHLSAKIHNGLWAFCIPAVEDSGYKQTLLFDNLNHAMKHRFRISASMAISQIGHSVRDIANLYSEAVNIHEYSFVLGTNRMIAYEDVHMQGQVKYDYPNEIEKKLMNHLFNGRFSETMEAFEEFVSVICHFTIDEIRLSCMLLAYAINAAAQKTLSESSGLLIEFETFYKKLQAAEGFQQVQDLFRALFKEIADKLKRNSKERHEVLIERIEAYVEENYGNINLSMNQISDHVNMSAAYLGRLFKQVTGITFIEYLTRYRLKIACSLLRDTEMTVNEISDKVGFTNSSYFYIIFKKNMECTPNQYRRQLGNNVSEE